MEITINAIEVASELAHQRLVAELPERFERQHNWGIYREEDMWQDLSNGDKIYKEQVQDIFNMYYDEFFEFLTNSAINMGVG